VRHRRDLEASPATRSCTGLAFRCSLPAYPFFRVPSQRHAEARGFGGGEQLLGVRPRACSNREPNSTPAIDPLSPSGAGAALEPPLPSCACTTCRHGCPPRVDGTRGMALPPR
jgi:hypothetical protein